MENVIAMLNEKSENLSMREMKLWNQIRTNSGVLMAYGIPGISKSATFRAIADKMGMNYIDIRTSTIDETQLGEYPTLTEYDQDGRILKVVGAAVPEWAIKANERPTLIHFEELNRCQQNIRNAALGILLERIIGTDFKFNNNVYMVASGNPETDYESDVETFGTALRNRLIPIEFTLKLEDWIKEFAEPHGINKFVTGFLNAKINFFGNTPILVEKFLDEDDPSSQYPSPRSWTFLSDYVNAFPEAMQKDALTDVTTLKSYVGETAATSFVNYVLDTFKISVKDVLSGKAQFDGITSDVTSRLVAEFMESYKYYKLNEKQRKNWQKFMEMLPDENLSAHITSLLNALNSGDKEQMKAYKSLLENFKDTIKLLKQGLVANRTR
jgi:hypothetical protein